MYWTIRQFKNLNKILNMSDKLDKIFEIVAFYDKCRWSDAANYNLINFFDIKKSDEKSQLDDDTKLLTHWLCYISNRQMGFNRIFDVGGFVYSELANRYKSISSKEELFALLDPNTESSFIRNPFQILIAPVFNAPKFYG